MKRHVLLFVFTLMAAAGYAQQKISVLGDSYSTFDGHVNPATNKCWYHEGKAHGRDNDVTSVQQTWWQLLANMLGDSIEVNNSFSGATICCTGYGKNDYSDRAFVSRMYNLGNPDIILIFGGTNDSWANVPMGDYQDADWTKTDLFRFRPAMSYMLARMKQLYPHTRIFFLLNTELSGTLNESAKTVCEKYAVPCIVLENIDKKNGHPSILGMKQIAEQVAGYIK